MRARNLSSEFIEYHEKVMRIPKEVHKWIVGMDDLIEMLLVGLLAKGHILTEGRVGEGKTRTLDAFARAAGGEYFTLEWGEEHKKTSIQSNSFKRIQFSPDRLPESLVRIVRQRSDGLLEFLPGPVFAHFVLGDEFNRASERTRAPLLETMEEGQVTIDDKTYVLPKPYMVLATINPTDVEGVYPLGAAQSDRFLMKVHTSHETREEIFEVLKNRRKREKTQVETVISREDILVAQDFVADEIFIADELRWYIADIAIRARDIVDENEEDRSAYGASGKRPALSLDIASQALAFVRGQGSVTPEIIKELVPNLLRHRISLGRYSSSRGDVEHRIQDILKEVEYEIPRS